MTIRQERDEAIINKFLSLLRSGMDYDVKSMYAESGRIAYVGHELSKVIINNYYKKKITSDMREFVESLKCKHIDKIRLFSNKFDVCQRESRLMIRYIRRSCKKLNDEQRG